MRLARRWATLKRTKYDMKKMKLNICSLGDPTNPKTWSGTTFNLYSELLKRNCLGTAFNSSINKYVRILILLISKFYYKNSDDTHRGLLLRYLNANKVIKETIKSNSNYTLHTTTWDLPFYKFPKNQKHYLYIDYTWNLYASYSTRIKGFTKRLLKDAEKLEIESYHQMEHIFPISEYVKNNLINHYGINPQKITVVGTGLGVIKPYHGLKNYSNGKILFAAKGRFEDKGGSLVLKAFEIALQTNPNLELLIVGQNEYTKKIDLPNVKTYGFISIVELQNIFNDCSLFLMPAINEPWGLVYLEALACKMPIVGLNRNSFPEISGNGKYGFGLNEAEPEKLAKILISAFCNPQSLEEMGIKGQDYCINKFSWSNTVSKIIKTINNLINE